MASPRSAYPAKPRKLRKRTTWRRPPATAKTLEDLAFYADLGIPDVKLSRGLYLLLMRAFLEGANLHISHILNRPDPERLDHLRRAKAHIDRQLRFVKEDMEADGYGREFTNTLAEQIRHRLNKRWL